MWLRVVCTGVAAILWFPMPELEEVAVEEKQEPEEESKDEPDAKAPEDEDLV